MTEVSNIRGEFPIELAGQKRVMKANFAAIERLESGALGGKSIIEALVSVERMGVPFRDVVSLIEVGLAANNDTRLKRDQIGDAVLEAGLVNFVAVYKDYLTYCITGGKPAKEAAPGE